MRRATRTFSAAGTNQPTNETLSQGRRLGIAVSSVLLCLGCTLLAVLYFHQVDKEVTHQDRATIDRILTQAKIRPLQAGDGYASEIGFIQAVQRAVLQAAPGVAGIPYDRPREPKDVYEAKSGLCYDRSRVIEKILIASGFRVRHVAVYSTDSTGSKLLSLLTPGVASHALTEVKTNRGWLLIDSNQPWIALDADANPVSARMIEQRGGRNIRWDPRLQSSIHPIFKGGIIAIYGLYSRHGRFYPPFNPIPDIHWGELAYNLLG